MCTAVIVASLPGLKALITRGMSPQNTQCKSNQGYIQTGSGAAGSRSADQPSRRSRPKLYPDDDSEVELVVMEPLPRDYKAAVSASIPKVKDATGTQITARSDDVVERT